MPKAGGKIQWIEETFMSFYDRIYDVVRKVPKGKVITYGMVACLAGNPRAARVVGYALHANPEPYVIPCHRVVNRNGGLTHAFAFGGIDEHKVLLESEGVEVIDYTVDLSKYLWDGKYE